jgi:NDP-sugar pyrophosphorylase family protein
VVTRAEFVPVFRGAGLEVVEETPTASMATLSNARRHVGEPFAWIGGDMLLTDDAPVRDLVREHREAGSCGAFFYVRTDRFKAKLRFDPDPEVLVTREGTFPFSLLNFGVHAPRLFAYLPGGLSTPRDNFLQHALEGGEPILFREYRAPVFEIDTPGDLAEARRFYAAGPGAA